MARRKRILFALVTLVVTLVALAGLGEVVVRVLGHEPFRGEKGQTIIDPPGAQRARPDALLGWTSVPGRLRITLRGDYPGELTFTTTVGEDGLRITGEDARATGEDARATIGIFGCSYTFGETLDDERTYAWLLQERFPRARVLNFGTNGYGTIHGLLQLRRRLEEEKKPLAVAVFAYASFHDVRNALLRERTKTMPNHVKERRVQPLARFGADGKIEIRREAPRYARWPLMKQSALVHDIEKAYNRWEAQAARASDVSRALFLEVKALCEKHGVALVVAGIEGTPETAAMLEWCKGEKIRAVDISTDLRAKGMTNEPFDPHPSAAAARVFAEKLGAYLAEQGLAEGAN